MFHYANTLCNRDLIMRWIIVRLGMWVGEENDCLRHCHPFMKIVFNCIKSCMVFLREYFLSFCQLWIVKYTKLEVVRIINLSVVCHCEKNIFFWVISWLCENMKIVRLSRVNMLISWLNMWSGSWYCTVAQVCWLCCGDGGTAVGWAPDV